MSSYRQYPVKFQSPSPRGFSLNCDWKRNGKPLDGSSFQSPSPRGFSLNAVFAGYYPWLVKEFQSPSPRGFSLNAEGEMLAEATMTFGFNPLHRGASVLTLFMGCATHRPNTSFNPLHRGASVLTDIKEEGKSDARMFQSPSPRGFSLNPPSNFYLSDNNLPQHFS